MIFIYLASLKEKRDNCVCVCEICNTKENSQNLNKVSESSFKTGTWDR